MAFYDLPKAERAALAAAISADLAQDLGRQECGKFIIYFSDGDTYIRKAAYLAVGRLYFAQTELQQVIIRTLKILRDHDSVLIRQTVINAAGEIGKRAFDVVQHFFDAGLLDNHHAPRNAIIGSVKKMGEVNPEPVLAWAATYLHHGDEEIRREICHGIELRGRTHPEDILPLLKELQHDKTARVRNTLVHVIGQIAYKKGCLATVIHQLNSWDNRALVQDALCEIIDVHHRYRNFSALTQNEARAYIKAHYQP